MSRPLRIEYEGAWYHVMNRGIDRQLIYKNVEHKSIFVSLLAELAEKYFVEIHAFCLMDNHYHILCRTPIPNLGKAMRHLDGLYTRRFNISENRDGSLFRGRYKAILIEEESYLIRVSRYIHLNPVIAKICQYPSDYPWSSCKYYLNKKQNPPWIKTTEILKYFSNNAVNQYEKFILEGIDSEINNFYDKKFSKSILGSNEFIEKILANLTSKKTIFCRSDIERFKKLPSIELVASVVAEYFHLDKTILKKTKRGTMNLPRTFAIVLAQQCCQSTYQKISEYFTQLQPDSIGMIIKRFKMRIQKDDVMAKHHENLIQLLNSSMLHVST